LVDEVPAMSALSWLKPMLDRIEASNRPRPIDGNVVDIPGGIERLRKAIVSVQIEAQAAAEEAAAYEDAWAAAQMEYQAAVEKNRIKQQDIAQRLYRLRSEWMTISEPLGIEAHIRRETGE
jgi:hypothetical protein